VWSPDAPLRRLALNTGLAAAALHRRRLDNVRFIAVTGSCGKTTTKELIAGVLGSELHGNHSVGYQNRLTDVGVAVLHTARRHAFCVIEVAAWKPGSVARAARVVQPHVAVVLNVGGDHCEEFGTLEATAREKSDLLAEVVDDGIAVLNADDPHVIAMADAFSGRIITFGRSPDAVLSARDVRAAWPERLSFTLRYDGRSLPVQTRLCGKHWVSSALATLGVAVATGIPLERAVDALAGLEPYPGRMSPVEHDGVTFIRDDKKAPLWTMDAALEFLAEAQADRKIAVIGKIVDYHGASSPMYRSVARRALAVADAVVFGGRTPKQALGPETGPWPQALRAFTTMHEARDHVLSVVRPGDLVLLKGARSADQLYRIVRAYAGGRPARAQGELDQERRAVPSAAGAAR
jgi:UDP-N-acetylmuramoyl-tripeptide--D-alanyl-D-alanine ligase